jgi:DNA repair protein RecO
MSYTTYTTNAIVCGTYDRNTADRSYRLFTRELGMVWADARSVRKESSLQRQALQDFSLIKVSLVKGRTGWKIGSVSEVKNYYSRATDQAARGSVVKLIKLLRRFLTGEEAQSELFDECVTALDFFVGTCVSRDLYERVFTQRILAQLGYIATSDIPSPFVGASLMDIDQALVSQYDEAVARSITRAETASQL